MLIIITKRGKVMKSLKKLMIVTAFLLVIPISHTDPLINHDVKIQMNEEVWPKG